MTLPTERAVPSPHLGRYIVRWRVCGTWIPTGTFHSCGITPGWSPPTPSLPDQTDRLIGAIERLIAALARLESKLSQQEGK